MIETLNQIIEDGFQRKLVHNFTATQIEVPNSSVVVETTEMVNFGSCSYLGLEKHEDLKKGVVEAVTKYGTQFSSSRTYLSHGLYKELETLLAHIFKRPLLVSASTTLGHLATIPVVVGKNDAVILDLQVHSSIQMTVQQLKVKQIPVHIIKHNCMESLETKIKALSNKHDKIWYFADGVYSMYGDFAPFKQLDSLLETYDKFHLYIDDAHGMGWQGTNGCGVVESSMKHKAKTILAVSLNKSFAAAGGCIIFPNAALEKKVRNCGPTYIFSGPIQPPMLGAAVASAKLHLAEAILPIQDRLTTLIQYTNTMLDALGLPQYQKMNSPLFFIPVGLPKICYDIISKMKSKGFFLNTASFPAVPMRKSGIRFMVNVFLSETQIKAMLTTLQQVYTETILAHQTSYEKIAKTFNIPAFTLKTTENPVKPAGDLQLKMATYKTIQDLDEKEWNRIFYKNGTLTHANLALIESVYKNATTPENNWDFHYLVIRDETNAIILKTVITVALTKDDMFHPSAISKKIEALRVENEPYYLTSKTVLTGTLITKGSHVYIDYENPSWKNALALLTRHLNTILDDSSATKIMIRDFYGPQDQCFETEMLEKGFVKLELPPNMVLEDLNWKNKEAYLKGLPQKYRYNVKKEIVQFETQFITSYEKIATDIELLEAYQLYESVYNNAYDLNVFKLPLDYFKSMNASVEYDIIRLYLNTDTQRILVGVMFSHVNTDLYNAMIVGLHYDYVYTHNSYKQILYQTVLRAKALQCKTLDFAFTAELVKKKLGARPKAVYAYVQTTEHLKGSILEFM